MRIWWYANLSFHLRVLVQALRVWLSKYLSSNRRLSGGKY
jgi:hypothetical protein